MNDNDFFSYEDFKTEKRRNIAKYVTTGGITLFFVINALLTGVYGAFSVWSTYPIGQQTSFGTRALVVVAGFVVAAMLVTLLDGSRLIWAQAAIAPATSGAQQGLARAMEIGMIASSTAASIAAMRVLLDLVGMVTLTDVELENAGMMLVWIATGALFFDFVVGWLYGFTSPAQKATRAESKREAFGLDTISEQAEYQLEAAKKALPAALQEDHPRLISQLRDLVRRGVNESLEVNAPRQIRAVASDQPSIFGTGGGGDGAEDETRPN